MNERYPGIDDTTGHALLASKGELAERLGSRLEVHPTNDALISGMADLMLADISQALGSGRDRAALIVPVGPVGQYQLIAERAVSRGIPLERLTIFVMDEYLTNAGEWIDENDPLSFRGHIRDNLLAKLPEGKQPEVVIPDPSDIRAVPRRIDELGGLDASYAGVGITGHLAFNDPIEGVDDPEHFGSLPTRVVALSADTRLINSVTAARGNTLRIPHYAVTVGMKEILGARQIRIFMNREWQCAAIRRLALGPVTARYPASLVQRHANWSLHVVDHVLDEAEPGLR